MSAPGIPRRSGRGMPTVAWAAAVGIPLLFLGVFFVWPVAALVARGFAPEGVLDLTGVVEVLEAPRTWRLIAATLGQAAVGTVIAVVLGIPGAYVLYRGRFPGRTVLRGLVTVPFVLPTVVVGVAFRSLFVPGGALGGWGLDESFAGIVVALVFFNYAIVVRTVGGLWQRLDPRAGQAAQALGASGPRVFFTVTLPALAPAVASAASIVFLYCATAFGVVLVLGGTGYGTIETEIWIRTTQFLDLRGAAVLSVLQLVVVAAALWVSGRARARYERAQALTGDSFTHRLRLRRPVDLVPSIVTAAVVAGLLLFPLAGLVVRSFRVPGGGWGIQNYLNLGTTGGRNALTVTVWEAAGNSLRTALMAAAVAILIGGLVALVLSRRPRSRAARRGISALDAFFMLPLGVSAVTVGFGFLITLDRPLGLPFDLRTSGLLVPLAQAVVAIPLVVRTLLPVLRAIDPRQREVAAVLGASPGRVLGTVDLALAMRSLGLALGFAFAVSLGEFGATSFLARPDTATLPVVIFRLIGRPGAENFGMALAASVVLATLTAAVMLVAERLRGDRAIGGF